MRRQRRRRHRPRHRRRATQAASSAPSGSPGEMTAVRLQLQWEPQAQFAGYFAADREGYYEEEGLEVEFLRGGADIIPQDRRHRPERSRVHHLVGAQGARRSGRTRPSRTWSTSPRSSSVRAPDPCHGRLAPGLSRRATRTSPRLSNSPARTSACGTTATSTKSPPAALLFDLVAERGLHQGHPAVRHEPAAQSRSRCRRGDDLQRVRPGSRGRRIRRPTSCTSPKTST